MSTRPVHRAAPGEMERARRDARASGWMWVMEYAREMSRRQQRRVVVKQVTFLPSHKRMYLPIGRLSRLYDQDA